MSGWHDKPSRRQLRPVPRAWQGEQRTEDQLQSLSARKVSARRPICLCQLRGNELLCIRDRVLRVRGAERCQRRPHIMLHLQPRHRSQSQSNRLRSVCGNHVLHDRPMSRVQRSQHCRRRPPDMFWLCAGRAAQRQSDCVCRMRGDQLLWIRDRVFRLFVSERR